MNTNHRNGRTDHILSDKVVVHRIADICKIVTLGETFVSLLFLEFFSSNQKGFASFFKYCVVRNVRTLHTTLKWYIFGSSPCVQ